jgi:hypothetical protein
VVAWAYPAYNSQGHLDPKLGWIYSTYISGGPGAPPGETAAAVINLPPGDFALWSSDPFGPDPVPVTVTGQIAAPQPEPVGDVTVQEVNVDSGYAFHIEGEFKSGPQVIEIHNDSQQPHTMLLFPVDEQFSDEDLSDDEQLETLQSGGTSVPYASLQSSSTTTWLETDLLPGKYVLACFVSDIMFPGFSHAQLGLAHILTVD